MRKFNYLGFILTLLFGIILFSITACQTPSTITEQNQHPLINKIWSIADQAFVSLESVQHTIQNNNIILLGETHDNIHHHQGQAQFITYLAPNKPTIAYEMLNQNQQSLIDQFEHKEYKHNQNSDKITDLFATTIQWEKSGWPEWSLYRPVFFNTIDAQLAMIATNMPLKQVREVIKKGSSSLDQHYQNLLTQYQYDDDLQAELEQEVQSAHCDMLPETMLAPMLLGQQVRDLSMTQAIQKESNNVSQVIVIAGSGHTRTDYGIPFYLAQENPALSIASIAFVEVSDDEFKPSDYISAWSQTAKQLPFDYVWFTPRAERDDPCEKMKAYMKKKRKN
ncbi:MAG: ChaN family lipoprotein [Gammaproteobacteria bacterium]|nr:ChaN family lipoprotein [Gammaproteobacteria bacterium]